MFGSRTAKLAQLIALTLALLVLLPGLALADNLQSDGDGLTPVTDSNLAFGSVCKGVATAKTVLLAINRNGSAGSTNVYKDASSVTVTGSTSSSGLSITDPDSPIAIPGDWGSQANNTKSPSVSATVTLTATATGAYSGSLNWSATGVNSDDDELVRADAMSVSATVSNCDSTPPQTTIDSHPAELTNSTNASFTYSSNEAGSTFACKLDGGTFGACPSGTPNYSGLAEGSHTFQVRATDGAGNTDPTPASFTWTIDTTAPDTAIDSSPASLTNSQDATFTYSSEAGASFTCSLDGASFGACPSGTPTYTGLGEGPHTFEVRATDLAGNTDPIPASYSWTIDLTPPAVSAPDLVTASDSGSSASDNKTNDDTPTLEGTADPGSSFELLRGAISVYTTTIGAGGTWSFASASLADGSYTFVAKATDAAGNTATSAGLSVLIDTTAPTASASPKKADDTAYTPGTWSNQTVTVSYDCTDTGSGAEADPSDDVFSTDGANQSAGGTCTDVAGNSATATVEDIDIDKTAPSISAAAKKSDDTAYAAGTWSRLPVTVSYTCSDVTSGVSSFATDDVLSSDGADQSADGTCVDAAGNSASATFSNIDIDQTAPTNISWTGGPADGGVYYFGSVPGAPTNCTADDNLSGIASCSLSGYSTAVGNQTITGTATDNAGNQATRAISYSVVAWDLRGFYSPVDMTPAGGAPVWNTVKGGSTVPLKWEMFTDVEITDPAAITSIAASPVTCASGTADDIELTTTGGTTSPRYDWTAGQFIYNWQTPKKPGSCYRLTMTAGGTSISALFKLK